MRTIEIATTQNVTIEYELAAWRERFLAFLLDTIIIGMGFGILTWVGLIFDSDQFEKYWMLLVPTPLAVFYSLYMETILNGQTIGKRALGIRVVKLNGTLPTFSDYALRWSMRVTEIWMTLGALASLLISSSPKSQRLGDTIAGTAVIRLNTTRLFTLRDILKINTIQNYQPTYPEITRFSEQDMLFIKNVVERYRLFPNPAHTEALDALSKQVGEQLGVEQVPYDKVKFLKTLVNDYIVLTR